jgi:hypothetical protein
MQITIRQTPVLPILVFMIGSISVQAQTLRPDLNLAPLTSAAECKTADTEPKTDIALARQAVDALKRLERTVIVYESLADFESNSRIARVSFEIFYADLADVTAELEPLLAKVSDRKLRTQLINALDSYRDGAYWWSKIQQRYVITLQRLSYSGTVASSSDAFFVSTIPSTTVIHWRHAATFLRQAERLLAPKSKRI